MEVLSAVSGIFVTTIKSAEKIFEICAVDEQARGLLQTVTQVSNQLQDAKTLRHKKSSIFTSFEKKTFDECFRHTEHAITQVAALAEKPRADMDVHGGRVKLHTRVLFILRDSPNIQVNLTQLSIASQSLNTTLMTLMNREGRTSITSLPDGAFSGDSRPPPTYEEAMYLNAGRQRNMSRRASRMSLTSQSPLPPLDTEQVSNGLRYNATSGRTYGAVPHSAGGIALSNSNSPTPPTEDEQEYISMLGARRRNRVRRTASAAAALPQTQYNSRTSSLSSLRPTISLPDNMSELPADEPFDDGRSVISMTITEAEELEEQESREEQRFREQQQPRYIPYRPPMIFDGFDSVAPHQVQEDQRAAMGGSRNTQRPEVRSRYRIVN